MRDLTHVDQLRRRNKSESELAADYGEGSVKAGYRCKKNPTGVEGEESVHSHPIDVRIRQTGEGRGDCPDHVNRD